jgi:adenylate cyclase
LTQAAPPDTLASRTSRIRGAAALLVAALGAGIAASPRWTEPLREAWFDGYQRVLPRAIDALPAMIVEIDAGSLEAIGRWPWPRSTLAELVTRVAAHAPAAVGLDILMPEPDARKGDAASVAGAPPAGASPSNDELLARALTSVPSVLAIAGMPDVTGVTVRAPAIFVQSSTPAASLTMLRFSGAVGSIEALSNAAAGWGLVSVDSESGIVRRVPLVGAIGGTYVAAFAVEMFRVAARERALRLVADGASVRGVVLAGTFIATDDDGHVRVHFSKRNADRFVSAVDVLHGRAEADRLRGKLVIIAATGLGLGDYHATPVGERMPGAEIHAQLIESLYGSTLLSRPRWAALAEGLAVVVLGALLVWVTPLWKTRHAAAVAVLCIVAIIVAGAYAFAMHRTLIDAATPSMALIAVFTALLAMTLAEANRHRRSLERVVQRQREHAARLAGELDAARSIQLAMLPRADLLAGDPRVDIAASMLPAREVGGDLYDFFPLDDHRLFFLVGDVAGKGLPASLFMAVAKALYKSATLRADGPDIGALMRAANAEISRDNPQMLFVSAFAAVLDLDRGEVVYCNAGHDNPLRIAPAGADLIVVGDGDGPPLCVVDGYAYRGAAFTLSPGESLCIVSDGVPEARNPEGAMFGSARIATLLRELPEAGRSARAIVDALCAGVAAFTAGAAPYDDMTVLVVRWRGPQRHDRGDAGR